MKKPLIILLLMSLIGCANKEIRQAPSELASANVLPIVAVQYSIQPKEGYDHWALLEYTIKSNGTVDNVKVLDASSYNAENDAKKFFPKSKFDPKNASANPYKIVIYLK